MISARDALAVMQRLPLRPIGALLEAGPVLILAPHPDDESLGCGGLIAACCEAGYPPFVLVLTDGAGSHPNSRSHPPERLASLRMQEARDAVACLGLPPARIGFLGLPDTRSPVQGSIFHDAVAKIVALARLHQAGTVLATWANDPHCDHLSAHTMAIAASRILHVRHLAYPVWGWTLPPDTFLPGPTPTGWRTDIEAHLPAKRRAIAAHRSQYAGLISDDPTGFQLSPRFVALFDRPEETILYVE